MVFTDVIFATPFWAWFMAIFLLIAGIFLILFFILVLVHMAINRRWGWFIFKIIFMFFVLGLGLFLELVYLIIWISSTKFRRGR